MQATGSAGGLDLVIYLSGDIHGDKQAAQNGHQYEGNAKYGLRDDRMTVELVIRGLKTACEEPFLDKKTLV